MAKNRREALRTHAPTVRSVKEDSNPFTRTWTPELTLKKKRINLDKKPAFDAEGNRLKGTLFVPYEQDGERFIKVVREWLPEQVNLSRTAMRVLLFMQYQMLPGNSTVYLPARVGADFCKFSQTQSFHTGIAELILYEYLVRTHKASFYYLNPQKYFNGDRRTIKGDFSIPTHSYTSNQTHDE